MLDFYDSLFRYSAVAIFSLIGILSLREYGWRLAAVLGALSSFAAAAYLLETQPQEYAAFNSVIILLRPLNSLGVIFIWLFSLSQFNDGFQLKARHYGVAGVYCLATFADDIMCWAGDIYCVQVSSGSIAFIRLGILLHMIYVAWQGRADDLLETRRQFRALYSVMVTVFITAITIVETWFRGLGYYQEVYVFQAFSFVVLGGALILKITKVDHGIILVNEKKRAEHPRRKEPPQDAAERYDLDHIIKTVDGQKLYLEQGLTITLLSQKVGLPEHRVRRLINQHLGYRNFADFLNNYRISQARKFLAAPENRNQQILTIAMDLGYGSLGPFNRAFKERTGSTPSEYRKKALAETE